MSRLATGFVALLTFKGALPGVLAPLLKANNLGLSGALSLGERGLTVKGLHAQGQGLELFGTADSTGGPPHAVLLVKMGILSVGVEPGTADGYRRRLRPMKPAKASAIRAPASPRISSSHA